MFVVVRPGFFHAQVCAEFTAGKIDDENNVARLHHLRSEAFWRSLGFRRIGTSAWFALANTHEHPSRQLAANHDWDPPATGQLDVKMSPAWASVFEGILDQSLDDKDCITRLKIALESCPDTDSYKVVNKQGNTIMHLAAIKLRPVFLANIVETLPQLNNSRNIEGFLPVEALRARLERKRTVKEVFDAVLASPTTSRDSRALRLNACACSTILNFTTWQAFPPTRSTPLGPLGKTSLSIMIGRLFERCFRSSMVAHVDNASVASSAHACASRYRHRLAMPTTHFERRNRTNKCSCSIRTLVGTCSCSIMMIILDWNLGPSRSTPEMPPTPRSSVGISGQASPCGRDSHRCSGIFPGVSR